MRGRPRGGEPAPGRRRNEPDCVGRRLPQPARTAQQGTAPATRLAVALVAAEGLVPAVAGEHDPHLLARSRGQRQARQQGRIGQRLVLRGHERGQQGPRPGAVQPHGLVLGAEVARYRCSRRGFIEGHVVKAQRPGAQRPQARGLPLRAHERGIDAAREEGADRHLGLGAAHHRRAHQGPQLLACLVQPMKALCRGGGLRHLGRQIPMAPKAGRLRAGGAGRIKHQRLPRWHLLHPGEHRGLRSHMPEGKVARQRGGLEPRHKARQPRECCDGRGKGHATGHTRPDERLLSEGIARQAQAPPRALPPSKGVLTRQALEGARQAPLHQHAQQHLGIARAAAHHALARELGPQFRRVVELAVVDERLMARRALRQHPRLMPVGPAPLNGQSPVRQRHARLRVEPAAVAIRSAVRQGLRHGLGLPAQGGGS